MTGPDRGATGGEGGPELAVEREVSCEGETCDVVVVGTGLAGLRAAIAAAEKGARTIVVSKTEPRQTTSAIAWGGASGAVGGTSAEDYLAILEDKSRGLGQPSLRRVLAEDTGHRLEELERFGVSLRVGRSHVRVEGPFARPAENLVNPLAEYARRAGVEFRVGWRAVGLLMAGSGVAGVVGQGDGQVRCVAAPAVVLCGGGFAGLYARNDNIGGTTGDCIALGLLAGARAVDMEFVIFQPPGIAIAGRRMDSVYSRALVACGNWRTPEGEPIERSEVDEYFRRRAATVERLDERYDLLCDLSPAAERIAGDAELRAIRDEFLADWPLEDEPVPISPLAHYALGGIAIDASGGTDVPGLFAAGECTGGLFGADRPGGSALADCIVFGARAGEAGANYAAAAGAAEPTRAVELARTDAEVGRVVREEVGWALWNYVAVYRHEAGLDRALAWLDELAERLAGGHGGAAEGGGSCEGAAAVAVGRAVTLAARQRKESRGTHRRLDYPQADSSLASMTTAIRASDVGL